MPLLNLDGLNLDGLNLYGQNLCGLNLDGLDLDALKELVTLLDDDWRRMCLRPASRVAWFDSYNPERALVVLHYLWRDLSPLERLLVVHFASVMTSRIEILASIDHGASLEHGHPTRQQLYHIKRFFQDKTVQDCVDNARIDVIPLAHIPPAFAGLAIAFKLYSAGPALRTIDDILSCPMTAQLKLNSSLKHKARQSHRAFWLANIPNCDEVVLNKWRRLYDAHAADQFPLVYYDNGKMKQFLPDKKAYSIADLKEYIRLINQSNSEAASS
ncbi:hypothetical protein PSEUBRA_004469 [Kalmanozyma brasiliensis GHG001]|uniref:uncharacterized protein n=1 Tax=Kalmanozyma brasiliensis (strain GHG001) TaxID=1365824 RepID=UPI0028683A95|nr:uncharacterized protein PSEUBRA_004469 [Kalmanozyma brasiliensis GHG001]KAF6767383.1 hypothetical protein PSEUBRA_004469 [Kalmanozyma brasiliensis GHG001]